MAAQLIATNGPARRRLASWTPRASSSLPVPLAPSSRTETSALRDALDRARDLQHLGRGRHQAAQHGRVGGAVACGEPRYLALDRLEVEGAR